MPSLNLLMKWKSTIQGYFLGWNTDVFMLVLFFSTYNWQCSTCIKAIYGARISVPVQPYIFSVFICSFLLSYYKSLNNEKELESKQILKAGLIIQFSLNEYKNKGKLLWNHFYSRGQCSWVAKIFLVRCDIISLVV